MNKVPKKLQEALEKEGVEYTAVRDEDDVDGTKMYHVEYRVHGEHVEIDWATGEDPGLWFAYCDKISRGRRRSVDPRALIKRVAADIAEYIEREEYFARRERERAIFREERDELLAKFATRVSGTDYWRVQGTGVTLTAAHYEDTGRTRLRIDRLDKLDLIRILQLLSDRWINPTDEEGYGV